MMFCVDEATADAIRRAYFEDGELSAVIELRRHFPLITDHENARLCVRSIAGWQPSPPKEPAGQVGPLRPRRRAAKAP